ncbi:MAG: metalloregulator ArsR/SmtB family transcription factor [Lentisphaeria bacterium]
MLVYEKNSNSYEVNIFKALGHPIRLWIVKQLEDEQEHCVCEFVEAVDVKFATISQHLSILKAAGIIRDEKRGKRVFYRLNCSCIFTALECLVKKD